MSTSATTGVFAPETAQKFILRKANWRDSFARDYGIPNISCPQYAQAFFR
jgi:hypothetical protein